LIHAAEPPQGSIVSLFGIHARGDVLLYFAPQVELQFFGEVIFHSAFHK
jgi:hypothetical protein